MMRRSYTRLSSTRKEQDVEPVTLNNEYFEELKKDSIKVKRGLMSDARRQRIPSPRE